MLSATIAHYIEGDTLNLPDGVPDFARIDRVVMVACGTAYYACAVAKYWFEGIAKPALAKLFSSRSHPRDQPARRTTPGRSGHSSAARGRGRHRAVRAPGGPGSQAPPLAQGL